MRNPRILLALSLAVLFTATGASAQIDSDGDGVDDAADLCNGIDASFFDVDGDGCIDPTANARHREFWDPTDLPLHYVIHENGAPGIGNGSDFIAIQDAFTTWTALSGVALSATYDGTTPQAAASGMDGINQITFEDPMFLAVYGSSVLAVGITTSYDVTTVVAGGRTLRPGQIFDADMIFNPVREFATDNAGSGIDLPSVATHEAGHLFGLSHSLVETSTMFPALPSGTDARTLEGEDLLLAFMAYPDDPTLSTASTLSGTLLDGSDLSPVGGAAVVAISTVTGDTLGANYTLADGSWQFVGLPADSYFVAVAPLEGAAANGVIPGLVNAYVEGIATNLVWPAEFWNLGESADDDPTLADAIMVSAGAVVTGIDLQTNVDLSAPTLVEIAPAEGPAIRSDAVFFVQFSEAMDFTSATTNVTLSRVDGGIRTQLAFALIQVSDGDVFLVDPAAVLEYATNYELSLTGGITDRSGNALGTDIVRSFVTEMAPALQIFTVSPPSVVAGTVVVIYGEGFDSVDPGANLVDFNGQIVAATTANSNAISVTVPTGIPLGAFSVSVSTGAQTSNSLALAGVQPVDVVRGTDYATMALAGIPTSVELLPDGNFAYVGTSAGIAVATTATSEVDFGTHTELTLPFGIADLAVAADGKRVYAVSGDDRKLVVINSDYGDLASRNAAFNSVLDELPTDGQPTGITVDATGERAYIATAGGTVEVWDIEVGSATYHRQVGLMTSPVPSLQGALAVDRTGSRLFAMASSGDLLIFDLSNPTAAPSQRFVSADPRDLVVDPRGGVVYVTDATGQVSVVLVHDGSVSQSIPVGGAPTGLIVDASGTRAWFADRANDAIAVLDLVTGSPSFRTVTGSVPTGAQPVDVAVLPDGLFVLSAEAGSRSLRLIGIGEGPELTGIEPAAGRPGDYFVISGSGFAPTGEGILSALEYFLSGGEETPNTRVWFGNQSVRPLSATASKVSVRAPAGWNGEPVRVAYNGPAVAGQPTTLMSNAITARVLEESPPDLVETATRAVFMDPGNGYAWDNTGVDGTIAVSPTGEFALVVSLSNRISMIDADPRSPDQGQVIADYMPVVAARSGYMVVAPDGLRAYYSGTDDQVHVIDTDPDSPGFMSDAGILTDTNGNPPVFGPQDLHITPSGNLLVVEDSLNGGICLFRLRGAQPYEEIVYPVFGDPGGQSQGLAIHPSGLWTIYAADTGKLHRVSLNANRLVFASQTGTWTPMGTPLDVAFTPDGKALLVVSRTEDNGGSYWLEVRRPWLMMKFLFMGNAPQLLASGVADGPATIEVSANGDRAIVDLPAAGQTLYIDVSGAAKANVGLVDSITRTSVPQPLDMGFTPFGIGLYTAASGDTGIAFTDFANSVAGSFVSGLGQVGQPGEALPAPVLFAVTDDQGQASSGAVAEVRALGGGSLGNGRNYQWLTSNANGVISIDWTMGPDLDGDPASPANNLLVTLNGGATVADNVEVPALEDPTTVPMNLVEQLPAASATDVSLSTTIQARFSRPVDTLTLLEPDYFLRRQDDQTTVAVSYGFADAGRSASMVPAAPLNPSTVYEVVVGGGILDAEGGPLSNPMVTSFTTEFSPGLTAGTISPPAATAGTEVVIAGTGFSAVAAENRIVFNGGAITATGVGTDFVTAFVPVGATTGPVHVEVGGAMSNTVDFVILLPVTAPLDQVVTTVETGSPVQAIAVTPDGLKAYSVNSQANEVVPVDMLTFSVLTPIAVGSVPTSVAIHPDGTRAYVTNFGSGTVSVIDVNTDTVIETITVGTNPADIVASPNGDWLYVVNTTDQTLSVIDVDGTSAAYHTVVATAPTGKTTRGAAITPDGTLLYLGTADGFAVIDLDPASYGVVATAPTGKTTRGAAITPDGSLLFLVSSSNEILVVDISEGGSNAVIATVQTDQNATGAAITPDGTKLFLLQEGTNEVSVYEIVVEYNVSSTAVIGSITVRAELINTIPVAADPSVIAIDPSGSGIIIVGHATGDGLLTFLNSSSYPRQAILAEVGLDPLEVDALIGGRGVVTRICLPSGLDVRDIDVASLRLGGSIQALAGSERYELQPDGVTECLVFGLDRLQYQARFPQQILGRQLQPPPDLTVLTMTGLYGPDAVGFSGTSFAVSYRPRFISPAAGDAFWPTQPMQITWQTPTEIVASTVDLRISLNGGLSWDPVVTGVLNNGNLLWSTPGANREDILLEAVFRDGESVVTGVAISEGFFSILDRSVPIVMREVQTGVEDGVGRLSWSISDPQLVKGFHVLRAEREDGEYARVNSDLVTAANGPDGPEFVFTDEEILGNRNYFYMLQEERSGGQGFQHGPYRLNWSLRNELRQNMPNSFNPRTTISFSIAKDGPTRLAVYNLAGRLVDVLVDEHLRANTYDVIWEGKDERGRSVASGVYLYYLTTPGFSAAKKMTLVR